MLIHRVWVFKFNYNYMSECAEGGHSATLFVLSFS